MIRAGAVSIGIVDIDPRDFSLVIVRRKAGNRSRSPGVGAVLPRRVVAAGKLRLRSISSGPKAISEVSPSRQSAFRESIDRNSGRG